ncbi:hypothetical protein BKA80DRAFT_285805 [Phyllosticta citrichinensis]
MDPSGQPRARFERLGWQKRTLGEGWEPGSSDSVRQAAIRLNREKLGCIQVAQAADWTALEWRVGAPRERDRKLSSWYKTTRARRRRRWRRQWRGGEEAELDVTTRQRGGRAWTAQEPRRVGSVLTVYFIFPGFSLSASWTDVKRWEALPRPSCESGYSPPSDVVIPFPSRPWILKQFGCLQGGNRCSTAPAAEKPERSRPGRSHAVKYRPWQSDSWFGVDGVSSSVLIRPSLVPSEALSGRRAG